MVKNSKVDIDTTTHEVIEKVLEDENKQIELVARSTPIYILGCHESQFEAMEKIRDKITDSKFKAKLLQDIPDNEFLPDNEKQRIILQKKGIFVILDGKIGAVVGESSFLMNNLKNLYKCVLMVPKTNKENLLSRKEHYLYYPIKYIYDTSEELTELASGIAVQMAHLGAIIEVRLGKGNNNMKKQQSSD